MSVFRELCDVGMCDAFGLESVSKLSYYILMRMQLLRVIRPMKRKEKVRLCCALGSTGGLLFVSKLS